MGEANDSDSQGSGLELCLVEIGRKVELPAAAQRLIAGGV